MENSNVMQIPLDSPINIKSDDMLEDVKDATFVDNPQQYQGRYLPTSLRFEHNGWAAGDKVYNFKDESIVITDDSKRFTVEKYFISDNVIQLVITDTQEVVEPFSFYWSIKSLERVPDIIVTDDANGDAVAVIEIDTVYDDGAEGIPMHLRITWNGKTPAYTNMESLNEDVYDVSFEYDQATVSWKMTVTDVSKAEPEIDVTFRYKTDAVLDEAVEGAESFTLSSVGDDNELVFQYSNNEDIKVDSNQTECTFDYLSDIPVPLVDNSAEFNKDRSYDINRQYSYEVTPYAYKVLSHSPAATDIPNPFNIVRNRNGYTYRYDKTFLSDMYINETGNFGAGSNGFIFGSVPLYCSFSKVFTVFADVDNAPVKQVWANYRDLYEHIGISSELLERLSSNFIQSDKLHTWTGTVYNGNNSADFKIENNYNGSTVIIKLSELYGNNAFDKNGYKDIFSTLPDMKVTFMREDSSASAPIYCTITDLNDSPYLNRYRYISKVRYINGTNNILTVELNVVIAIDINFMFKQSIVSGTNRITVEQATYSDIIDNIALIPYSEDGKYYFMNLSKTSIPSSDIENIIGTNLFTASVVCSTDNGFDIVFNGTNFIVSRRKIIAGMPGQVYIPTFIQVFFSEETGTDMWFPQKYSINSYSSLALGNANDTDTNFYYVPANYNIDMNTVEYDQDGNMMLSQNSLHISDRYEVASTQKILFDSSEVTVSGFYDRQDVHKYISDIQRLMTLHIDKTDVTPTTVESRDGDVYIITQTYRLVTDPFVLADDPDEHKYYIDLIYTDRSDTAEGTTVVSDSLLPDNITLNIESGLFLFTFDAAFTYTFDFSFYHMQTYDTQSEVTAEHTLVQYNYYTYLFDDGITINVNPGDNTAICIYKNQPFEGTYSDGVFSFEVNFVPVYNADAQLIGLHSSLSPYSIIYDANHNKFAINVNGQNFYFDADIFRDKSFDFMTYNMLDVNASGDNVQDIHGVDTSKEMQFLKQQWDSSVNTENFWWLDSTHILKLTQTEMILLENNGELDDWNANKWDELSSRPRYKYINNDFIRYGVSCANNETALFYNVSYTANSIIIKFYDMLHDMDEPAHSIQLAVNNISLGSELNSNTLALNTYTLASAYDIVTDSDFSCTVINGYVLFGIHYDNNFNQWAIKYNKRSSAYNIVQGYGYVGVNGSLTGGEIPTRFFDDTKGFNSTVYSLDNLSQDTITEVTEHNSFTKISAAYRNKVFGTDTTQYYVADSVDSIVSHLIWNNNTWRKVVLTISSNYDSVYYSGSFARSIRTDYEMQTRNIIEMIPNDLKNMLQQKIEDAVSKITRTEIPVSAQAEQSKSSQIVNEDRTNAKNMLQQGGCLFQAFVQFPRLTNAVYLQQSAGQYAYVHHNNTDYTKVKTTDVSLNEITSGTPEEMSIGDNVTNDNNNRDKLRSGYLIFDIKRITQEQKIESFASNIADALLVALADMPFIQKAPDIINSIVNPTIAGDEASGLLDTYSQLVASNVNAITSSPSSTVISCTSRLMSCLSLDMFYSTSDLQKVCAGRGYVNHNFVAQMVAQSSVSRQMEYTQFVTYMLFRQLTTWPLELLKSIGDGMQSAGNSWSNFFVEALGSGAGGIFGSVISMLGYGITSVCSALLNMYNMIFDFYGGKVMTIRMSASGSKHNIDIEAKHKYGDKSEHFMWPSFGIDKEMTYCNETVEGTYINNYWQLYTQLGTIKDNDQVAYGYKGKQLVYYFNGNNNGTVHIPELGTDDTTNAEVSIGSYKNRVDSAENSTMLNGKVPYYVSNAKGKSDIVTLPDNMACIIGTEKILPDTAFKNENIGVDEPVFTTPIIHDYMLDNIWKIGVTATDGMTLWLSVGDTKVIDGDYSNIVVSNSFCGIASPYTAIEVKHGIHRKYVRPTLVTPEALAFNNTGYNCIYQGKMYHAFDGQGYRTVEWIGTTGFNKEQRTLQYNYIVNDRFKRSNKLPPNEVLGSFLGEPVMHNTVYPDDSIHIQILNNVEKNTLQIGTIGEDKDIRRLSIPVFSEYVNTLPAVVRTISPIPLSVVDGITSLTTDNRNLQSAYKIPVSVDFAIGKNMYRQTAEYICAVRQEKGVEIVDNMVPSLGLTFMGATPYEAYFYSDSTKQYYRYTGGTSLTAVDTVERFRRMTCGRYNFIEQNVAVQFIDRDEEGSLVLTNLKDNKFSNNVFKAISTIYNDSGYKIYSIPCGLLLQGPNRCIINRYFYNDYMLSDIKDNMGKWTRVDRENYSVDRMYAETFQSVDVQLESDNMVKGWTYNPFSLILSPLGVSQETDCLYEWEITFCWTKEMDNIYGDKYATVCISSDTYEEGGIVKADRPVHIYLTRELFSRSGCYGYYSFRYQSKCGAGNREKLKIWSDQYIAISAIQCEYAMITSKRQAQLTQQVDVQLLEEM